MIDTLYLLTAPAIIMLIAAVMVWHRKRQAGASMLARLHSRSETTPSVAPAEVLRAERDRA